MADSNIGSLPQAATLDDDSLLVAEQQGTAVKVTGAQFKEFGKQAVISQVQGYVDQAEAAADEAVSAVSAVTDMTVEAATLSTGQSATVTKSIKNGKVNLAFGLPRGEQGEAGATGAQGPRGPQGPTGKGLTILGYYDTLDDLETAVPSPNVGDAYGVGLIAPYNIYVFDGVSNEWKDNGQLSGGGGGGGGPLPDDVVTADGGAEMTFPLDLGTGPHTITFTDDAEPPLTAEDVQYSTTQNVKQAIDGLKSSVSSGKALIASAITDKGVTTAQDATFAQMAENIGEISTGSDTTDATATSFDILAPKTAYTAVGKVEGTIPTLLGQTIMPGTSDQTIANGQYLGGTQVIKGDPNLTSSNIKSGVTLFGVAGALESTFQATLTVTVDIGAVVTATHSGGASVSALSQTGTVVLDLPLEGTWSVTAIRGVAQYNTAIINVTSSYSASLTARIYIEYFKAAEPLSVARKGLSSAAIGNYVLFGGGSTTAYVGIGSSAVDAYSTNLTHTTPTAFSTVRTSDAATVVGNYALFGGGYTHPDDSAVVDAYNQNLTRTTATALSVARRSLAATTIGNYAIFCGGVRSTTDYSTADAYDQNLTRITASNLSVARGSLAATSVGDYALFGGGFHSDVVDAYNKSLTRTTATRFLTARGNLAATTVGNYALFGGGYKPGDVIQSGSVDAYNQNLTRTTATALSVARRSLAATTVTDYALFGGGYIYPETSIFSNVDVYDETLTHTVNTDLSLARGNLAAGSIGNYGLFAGGDSGSDSAVVDVYRHL